MELDEFLPTDGREQFEVILCAEQYTHLVSRDAIKSLIVTIGMLANFCAKFLYNFKIYKPEDAFSVVDWKTGESFDIDNAMGNKFLIKFTKIK